MACKICIFVIYSNMPILAFQPTLVTFMIHNLYLLCYFISIIFQSSVEQQIFSHAVHFMHIQWAKFCWVKLIILFSSSYGQDRENSLAAISTISYCITLVLQGTWVSTVFAPYRTWLYTSYSTSPAARYPAALHLQYATNSISVHRIFGISWSSRGN